MSLTVRVTGTDLPSPPLDILVGEKGPISVWTRSYPLVPLDGVIVFPCKVSSTPVSPFDSDDEE